MKGFADQRYLVEVQLQRAEVPSFADYPFCLPAVRGLHRLVLHPAVTFLVGENGAGKSTLLEAVAVAWGFNPEGGSKNLRFKTRESHSRLHEFLVLSKGLRRPTDGYFLRAESFFNVATQIDELDRIPAPSAKLIEGYGGQSLHEQSHGESFLALLQNRFSGHGLYLLDEPEAALSPSRQMTVLSRIHQLVQQHSQFIIATHSPIIMAYPNAKIVLLTEKGLKPVRYTDTEHYAVARRFLTDTERMLGILMAKEPSDQGAERDSEDGPPEPQR